MFENIMRFFKKFNKKEETSASSKDAAKERLHLVLMQDRANVSADFLELMKQEIIDVIKKYIDVDESAIDVRLTNKENSDGTNGAPALYANIPILNIKNEARKVDAKDKEEQKEDIIKEDKKHKENKEIEADKEETIEEKETEEKNIQEDVDVIIDETSLEKEETNNRKNEDNKEEKLEEKEKTDKSKEKIKSEN